MTIVKGVDDADSGAELSGCTDAMACTYDENAHATMEGACTSILRDCGGNGVRMHRQFRANSIPVLLATEHVPRWMSAACAAAWAPWDAPTQPRATTMPPTQRRATTALACTTMLLAYVAEIAWKTPI